MPIKVTDLGNDKYKVEGFGIVSNERSLEMGICPRCMQPLAPIYETIDLEGRYREITGYKPCECERSEK